MKTTTGMLALLSPATDALPLDERLSRASHQLAAMIQAGELEALPSDTRCSLSALALMLLDCGSCARESREAAELAARGRRRRWGFRLPPGWPMRAGRAVVP